MSFGEALKTDDYNNSIANQIVSIKWSPKIALFFILV